MIRYSTIEDVKFYDILTFLSKGPATTTDLYRFFDNNMKQAELHAALNELFKSGRIDISFHCPKRGASRFIFSLP